MVLRLLFTVTEAYVKPYGGGALAKYEYAADVTITEVIERANARGKSLEQSWLNRTLDPATATITTSTARWVSDVFTSMPDHVIAWTIAPRALGPSLRDGSADMLTFDIGLGRTENARMERVEEDAMCLVGETSRPRNRAFGRPFGVCLKLVCPDDGCSVESPGFLRQDGLRVRSSTGFFLLVSSMSKETYLSQKAEYKQLQQRLLTGSLAKISRGLKHGLQRLHQLHVQAYQALYNRMSVNIKGRNAKLSRIANQLVAIGRYLTISSSAPGSKLPMNLQGLWSEGVEPMWNCDFHLNVNLQMAYWGVHSTGLTPCAKPLRSFTKDLAKKGRQMVKTYYNVSQGWNAHGYTDVYMFAGPRGESMWNLCISCGAW